MMFNFSLIVAVAENGVIGQNGSMPWNLPSDLSNFKKFTMNKPMIMGRKTWESIGRPLPGRDNIVVTRQKKMKNDGVIFCENIEQSILKAKECAKYRNTKEIMVIGGEYFFNYFLKIASKIYYTQVLSSPDGDVFFPNFDKNLYNETFTGEIIKMDGDSCSHRLKIFEKK
tara:strand:+ start:233 stop:742 length:510 start_codon:yes stop_codon:yes gene_type:complete